MINIIIFFGATLTVLILLFMQFGAVRLISTTDYDAVFANSSGLKDGESVRIAGVEVGKVRSVEISDGTQARVGFDVDSDKPLTGGTRATIRYANLTGDRFLELSDGPGPTERLVEDDTIPVERTQPALDIDVLLQGFTPLMQGLSPDQINQFANEVVTVLQGQGGTVESLFTSTSALTHALADRDQVIGEVGEVVDNLNTVLGTLNSKGDQVTDTVVNLQKLVSGLSADRQRIGGSLEHVDALTTSVAGLLIDGRPRSRGPWSSSAARPDSSTRDATPSTRC
ncbi:MCE-family protein Mce1B [Pseudonocardia sp. Ae168_Ps1]|nr:MCE-family protein Mce1B [Pseudonocardia sp. Ae150A_Ps1]OLL79446.1 MCE-family protein Mce1B [Pseudonocardia sp. Ae168_Ps1]OLL86419.1 MCE-family protein Mce1B [Pseudonocardia sp. Ae263_Ps1]OLL93540.1 MCE-family protein Mce1B [Pseudonocardia sp. Ae356_Ps1]